MLLPGMDHRYSYSMEPRVWYYSHPEPSPTTAANFAEATTHIQPLPPSAVDSDAPSLYATHIADLSAVVYGSNFIERVGCDQDTTFLLCRKVLLEHSNKAYRQRADSIVDNTSGPLEASSRAHREVVNHAMALKHIVESFVLSNAPFSEELIKSTHRILCEGLDILSHGGEDGGMASAVYAGQYRSVVVGAGTTNFVNPRFIDAAMARFVDDIAAYLAEAERSRVVDPFYIAAKACGDFVNIHPFADGNGRTCRLILNAILLRYAGIVCPIGGDEADRGEYLSIARKTSDACVGNGELTKSVLDKSVGVLRDRQSPVLLAAKPANLPPADFRRIEG